jgi:hypothetical protein
VTAPSPFAKRGTLFQRVKMDPDHATAVCHSMAVVVWRGATRANAISGLEALGALAMIQSPGGIGLIGVVEPGTPPPSADARKLCAIVNERLVARGAVGAAMVIPGGGFASAMYRGIVTGMSLISGHSYPFRVFDSTSDAVRWMASQLGVKAGVVVDVPRANAALEAFRTDYAAYAERMR